MSAAVAGEGTASADELVTSNNGGGIDTHLFRPAMDSKGFYTVNGSDILGKNDVSFGLVIDYGRNLLRNVDRGQQSSLLINHSFQGTLQFNYGIANILVVGVDMPVNMMQGDAQVDRSGAPVMGPPNEPRNQWGTNPLDSQTVGFLGLHSKVRILRVERGFGLALGVQIGGPVSDAPKNAGADPGFFYWPQLIAEKRLGSTGQFKVALNVGFRGHVASSPLTRFDNLRIGDEGGKTLENGNRVTYGLGLSYRALEALDLVAESYATFLLNGNTTGAFKPSNEVVGGIKLFIERNSYLMLGAGPRYTTGFEAADLRGFIGFVFEPSIGDRDGDGIKDDVDKCPDEPEDFDGFQDEDGCPDPDNDNDGIPDIRDRCPNEPEDFDGDQDDDGCPESNDGDRDGDGIPDSKDKCPDEPEDRDGFQDEDGCPDPDNDQDGIPDKVDACPNDPEDKDGFQDEDGCPDFDNDNDGIPDVADKCPGTDADVKANKDTKETYNGFQDDDGCPDQGDVVVSEGDIIILKKIQFRTNSAEILPESNKILDAVATTITHHPEFLLIEIAGHADERASDEYNLRLTQDRVNSVMAALVSRNVDRSRLRAKGYGEFCPEDPGHNEKAWEKNRRVEFKIVKQKDGSPPPTLGCANATAHGVKPDAIP